MTKEKLIELCISSTLHVHHAALAKGYVGVNEDDRMRIYEGRFGSGYIVHVPTELSNCSNSYHRVIYYIY